MHLPPFADDVFVPGRDETHLTIREKRVGRRRHQAEQQAELEATGQQAEPEGESEARAAERQATEARSQLGISPTELCCLQEKDPSLREAKATASHTEHIGKTKTDQRVKPLSRSNSGKG